MIERFYFLLIILTALIQPLLLQDPAHHITSSLIADGNMNPIAEIKSKVNIVDLARRLRMEVRTTGCHLFVRSIYNTDNNPSLCLYPAENKFFDFSSGRKGDVIDFYKDYYHIDTSAAVQELMKLYGIEQFERRTEKPDAAQTEKEKPAEMLVADAFSSGLIDSLDGAERKFLCDEVFKILKLQMFHPVKQDTQLLTDIKRVEGVIRRTIQLRRLEENKAVFSELYDYCTRQGGDQAALVYLIHGRKLSPELLRRFKVFTIANYNQVNNHMKKTFPLKLLQRSGLFNKKADGSGNLIFYNHRIIIPYLARDDIIYLRGRYFDINNNPGTGGNKYLGLINDGLQINCTKRFYNTNVLKKMLPNEKLYIVEGEFDCMALTGLGFNAICIPGSNNIPDPVKFRPLEPFKIVICVDNDEAGRSLQNKLIGIFMKMNKEVRIKQLNSKDINNFVVQND